MPARGRQSRYRCFVECSVEIELGQAAEGGDVVPQRGVSGFFAHAGPGSADTYITTYYYTARIRPISYDISPNRAL